MQQRDFRVAEKTEVHLAITIEINRRDTARAGAGVAERRVLLEAGHPADRTKLLDAPAGKVARRIVVLNLEARLHPLQPRSAKLDRHLVAIHHARDDDFLSGEDRSHGWDELFRLSAIAAEQVRLAVAHRPPVAGVALVPVAVDADLACAAVVKKYRRLADLRPCHDVLPLARMKTTATDVVLDGVTVVLAFDVRDLRVNDQVLLTIDFLHAQHDDVRRIRDHFSEWQWHLDVSAGGQREAECEQHRDEHAENSAEYFCDVHGYLIPPKPFRATSAHGLFG